MGASLAVPKAKDAYENVSSGDMKENNGNSNIIQLSDNIRIRLFGLR